MTAISLRSVLRSILVIRRESRAFSFILEQVRHGLLGCFALIVTGHLLLSASMDGKCKVWDVMGDRQVKRTYIGHTEGVK